jgi:hypothetical protein
MDQKQIYDNTLSYIKFLCISTASIEYPKENYELRMVKLIKKISRYIAHCLECKVITDEIYFNLLKECFKYHDVTTYYINHGLVEIERHKIRNEKEKNKH